MDPSDSDSDDRDDGFDTYESKGSGPNAAPDTHTGNEVSTMIDYQGEGADDESDDHDDSDDSSSTSRHTGRPGRDRYDNASDSEDELKWAAEHCRTSCRLDWARLHQKSYWRKQRIRYLRSQAKRQRKETLELRRKWREAEEKLQNKLSKCGKHTEITWREKCRKLFEAGPEPSISGWLEVCKRAHEESNICYDRNSIHPKLNLRAPNRGDIAVDRAAEQRFHEPVFLAGTTPSTPAFHSLPVPVLVEILRHLLVFNQPIHCVSRLDHHVVPDGLPVNASGQVSLLHRFHIGASSVSLTYATKPQRLLAPLQVCKKWCLMSCDIFYGANTFLFSSLGELQRIQHIELLWKGLQYLTYKPSDHGKKTSRRTQVLAYLPQAIRLKTIYIYVQETNSSYVRRRHETSGMVRYMEGMTRQQPNYRLCRFLRTLQGLDYLTCLRGVKDISWYNFDQWLQNRKIVPIRDFTFQQDVMTQAGREKKNADKILSQWRRLAPIFTPGDSDDSPLTDEEREALEAFLDKKPTGSPKTAAPAEGLVPIRSKPIATESWVDEEMEDGDAQMIDLTED